MATCQKADHKTWITASLIGYYSCVNAQNEIQNIDGQLQCALPPGFYLGACPASGDRMTADGFSTPGGNVLVAKCRVGNGPEETLKFGTSDNCYSGIQILDVPNRPGMHQLVCQVPSGSYLQTCLSPHVRDPWNLYNGASVLWAICTKSDGQPWLTQLPNAYDCFGPGSDISNNNGILTCSLPQPRCIGFYGTCIVPSGSVPSQASSSEGCPGNPYDSCP
jgi:hypothetical protein